jgi:O-methyltransferase
MLSESVLQQEPLNLGVHAGLRRLLRGTALVRVARAIGAALEESNEYRHLRPSIKVARPHSMLPEPRMLHLGQMVRAVLSDRVPGDFVECGVWRGGASFLMADMLRRAGINDRKVWLCDSFEGHRPPEEIDGEAALAYSRDVDSPGYLDNCRVALTSVQENAALLGLSGHTEFVKGYFDATLPANRERIGRIALLRIDCDWYASVRCCFEQLYDQVSPGGVIIIDDYFDYDGCSIAVHEWLAERRLNVRIETPHGTAMIRKV